MKRFFVFMALLCCVSIGLLQAQSRTITGTVTNKDDGFTMPGVSVLVKGTTIGTVTNIDGQYNLSVPADAGTLVFSFIGMSSQEQVIEGRNVINVVLESDSKDLDEVVVTAYGSKGKVGLKGAISVVSAKELEQMPVATFDQMLQGKTTGLQISSGSGQPGSSNTKVRIRGTGSIMASNEPLYVVDGVPIEPGVFGSLNANDFETVSVLKDAASTAIYGSRASNGVILITTKSGAEGTSTVNVRHQSGISIKGVEKFDMMNSSEKLWFEQIAKKGPGWELSPMNPNYELLSPEAQAAQVAELNRLRQINTDWQDQFYRNGKTMSNEVNFSGGNKKTKYYVSYQNYYQEGLSPRSDLNRNTGRLNLDHQLFENIRVGINTTIGQSKINHIESEGGVALSNPYAAVYLANPWEEPYNADGELAAGHYRYVNPHLTEDENNSLYNPYSKTGTNALDMMANSTNKEEETKFIGAFTLEWDVLPYLTAKSQYGIDYRHSLYERWVSPDSFYSNSLGEGAPGRDGSISETFSRRTATSFTNTLDFKKVFNDIHTISAVVGTEYLNREYFNFGYTGYGLDPKLPETPATITPGTDTNGYIPTVSGYKSERALFSLFSLVNYTYDGKYTFSGSLRRDGSSAFGTNNQYAVLYSAGFTWDVAREGFMSQVDWVNNLKFRISYGTTGNQEGIGNFESKTLWSNTEYAGNPGYYLAQAGDPNIKWEVAHKFNVGIDYNLFNNRLNGSIDLYNDRTSDLFIQQTFSAWDGVPGNIQTTNAGEMRNRGAELLINYDIIRNRDLTWTVGTNLSYNANEITDLGQVKEFEQGTSIVRVGLPINSHYIVQWAGVNPATGDAMYYTKDGQVTTDYSADNNVADFGSSEPPFFGGFNTSVSYKGFELSAHFTFAQGFYRFNNQSFFQENPNFAQFNMSSNMLDIWQKPGDMTEIQGVHSQREFSSKDIEDASYLRFRNLMIAYNVPKTVLSKVGFIRSMRLYGQGQNLFTWTKWTGFDPEDSNNIAQYEYPTPRIFTLGLDLTF
ncbi:TonB-dependent receptor [Carboxylicivirga mesophila]|uniref:TonB-dependent receptor n=1 Tax=Carboxylicivirga mesophila TaxID=1166478 RepID=A0ABS5K5G9_9BACT|nr:TonB-dependent receptor [Carboxylicivirga mesophila]MBS2210167.1 TonB-dependent receptor [Carboxylicivirga mesophila]